MSDQASYQTDDRDLPADEQRRLVIFPGGNGDWYVQVAPLNRATTEGVRICTSGGAAASCPGLPIAIVDAYRSMKAAQAGGRVEMRLSAEELEMELLAWRHAFPSHRYDFGEIVPIQEPL